MVGGVKLTCKDTFLSKEEFQQLLYIAVTGLSGTEVVTAAERMMMPHPAVLKPVPCWTGKQVVSSLLKHMCREPLPPLNLDAKARTPGNLFGAEHAENEVLFRHNELLRGVIDKNAIGNAALGIVHTVYELYGAELAGRLLSAFGRLFTFYLQDAGQTCGIGDLTLKKGVDVKRTELLKKVALDAENGLKSFLEGNNENEIATGSNISEFSEEELKKNASMSSDYYNNNLIDRRLAKVKMDGTMQSVINKSASDVIKACLPLGLEQSFLKNNFSMMVSTGAKGSAVNQSQISCFLGQQALEGQRVPVMISGKTLPSFRAYDMSARAGGFVRDRFLTGVKPQEYYFHCMAGREGLVDTAVKTSRSGYLQRCLVKHLEELKVNYDNTVRDSVGNIVQFLYGEDGLDPLQAGVLGGKQDHMLFLARNNQAFVHKYSIHSGFFSQGLEMDSAMNHSNSMKRARQVCDKSKLKADKPFALSVGDIILARKKHNDLLPWSRGNLVPRWFSAEILKERHADKEESKKSQKKIPSYDLRYIDDGVTVKKVPLFVSHTSRVCLNGNNAIRSGGGPAEEKTELPIFLMKPGLPDPAMSRLRLDTSVGACSEATQLALEKYVAKNPDEAITPQSTTTTIASEALELLLWVKYLRSMVNPGEAVGCIAAQSVGEPSTQMTLNTFHLAGHGGANVTLGIPRLREVIMTASKALKTPTMLLPLQPKKSMSDAKSLANRLSRLSLSELLHHEGGVVVGESVQRSVEGGRWERRYRIRLQFEDLKRIKSCFNVSFDNILLAVKKVFTSKLAYIIKLEQRRAGQKYTGKNDALRQFQGNSTSVKEKEDDQNDGDDDEAGSSRQKGKKSGSVYERMIDNEDDEDDDEDQEVNDPNDDMGNIKLGGQKEIDGYDDVEEEEDDGREAKADVPIAVIEDEEQINSPTPSKQTKKKLTFAETDSNKLEASTISFDEKAGWIELVLSFTANARRLLMAQIAEAAAKSTTVRATKDISNAYAVNQDDAGVAVQTEGVNFEAIWSLSENLIRMNEIKSNDIWRILQTYGVEAARLSIVNEITGVFGVYGINVNPRHLSLIADFMTRNGTYTAMNRIGMSDCSSPFLQMSFETTCTFLTKAAQEGLMDNLQSPSASVVLGNVPKIGTGCFDVLVPLH